MERQIQYINELRAYFGSVADRIIAVAKNAIAKRGVFNLVLSGGRTPQGLYQCLISKEFQEKFPWQQTHFFWGDERCVPADHPDNNANMAMTTMLLAMKVPVENIHRPPVEKETPQEMAIAYAKAIADYFQFEINKATYPVFDMVLLGLGDDGHTASLFPAEMNIIRTETEWFRAVYAPHGSPPGWRITMTLNLINHARSAMFLSIDAGKLPLIQKIIDQPDIARQQYPAAWIEPTQQLFWMIYPTTN